MNSKAAIATTSSHSSLYNIVPGALEEGLDVYVVCFDRDWELWSQYPDLLKKINILRVNDYSDAQSIIRKLNGIDREIVIVPHGSFVRYLSVEQLKRLKHPILGGVKILAYEGNRDRNSGLLTASGITTPKIFDKASKIDRPVMIKLDGAEGGKGYFIASGKEDFNKKKKGKKVNFIQEYVSGVSIYAHYFSSPIEGRCELLGFDRRLESNVNSQYLAPSEEPSFTVVGNVPIAVRESLVPEYHRMGTEFVEQTGLVGPFCIETICTSEPKIYAFEFSGRIVAGTTVWVPYGNTYANLLWNEPMYMGKRIAREIKKAYESDSLDLLTVDSPKLEEI